MTLLEAVRARLAPLRLTEWADEPTHPELPCVFHADFDDHVELMILGSTQWDADQAAGSIFRLLNGWLPSRDVPRLRVVFAESGLDDPLDRHSQTWFTLLRVEPKHYLA